MKKDFEKEIISLASNYGVKGNENSEFFSKDRPYIEALDNLFIIAQNAALIFNSSAKYEALSVYKLPKEYLEMFLEIPGRRGGFCIISPDKIVVFFDEEPNTITVIGKNRNSQSGITQSSVKIVQLLKATFLHEKDGFKYKDNTGGQLNPYDIVTLLIKWVVA